MPLEIGLVESDLRPLIERFYDRVRADPDLAPVFAEGVSDWDDHHARLTDFWSSIMFTSGRYKGNPVALHMRHADRLSPSLFERWLALWRQTTEEVLPQAASAAMQAKAGRIAESLQLAIRYRRPEPA
jgi:hemoglobin